MIARAFARVASSRALAAPISLQARSMSSKPRKAVERSPAADSNDLAEADSEHSQALARTDARDKQLGLLHNQFVQMFDDLEREFFGSNFPFSLSPLGRSFRPGGFGLTGERALGSMPMDVSETGKQYNIAMEIPGANKEELHINVENDVLTVSTEKKEEHSEKTDKFHKMERSYGRMQRSLRLPDNADADKIDASYADGVLKIMIPKSESAETHAKRIPIK